MRNGLTGLVVALGVVALMAAGCAKQEVVKKDEPVVQQQTTRQGADTSKPAGETPKQLAVQEAAKQDASAVKAPEFVLATVYFDYDKSDLRQDTRDLLSKNADALLKKIANAKIQVAGHCDERGSDEYNLALGERRAKSVAKYLETLGVKADRISTISYGKEKPAAQGNDEAAWSKNRRAEFVIIK